MTTFEEIRDEVAGMLADGKPLEDVIDNLEKRKNEMENLKLMTNEEWFNGLSIIEKAKALHKLYWEMQNHFDYNPDDEDYIEEYCLYWLKAIHREE